MVETQAVTAPARAHGNGSDAAVARTVRRRRGLPDRRAVVGALLVTTAAVGLFSAAGRAGTHRRHPYVVARRDLPPGAVFTAGDLVRRPMDLPPSVAARAFDDPSVLVGATLVDQPVEGAHGDAQAAGGGPGAQPADVVGGHGGARLPPEGRLLWDLMRFSARPGPLSPTLSRWARSWPRRARRSRRRRGVHTCSTENPQVVPLVKCHERP